MLLMKRIIIRSFSNITNLEIGLRVCVRVVVSRLACFYSESLSLTGLVYSFKLSTAPKL